MSDPPMAYAALVAAAAPYAQQLALGGLSWPILFPIFALPALSLVLSVANLSGKGPVLTYQRLAPVGAGIGWALTWHVGERLYVETLRASQNFLYILFSLRSRLDWALDCDHSYNSRMCNPFDDENATHTEFKHYPDNFWPAQEFNRYLIRGNSPNAIPSKLWEPNEWYLGRSGEKFFISFPSIPLMLSHSVVWLFIYLAVHRFSKHTDVIVTRLCVLFPASLYFFLVISMGIMGFSLTGSTEEEVPTDEIEKDPIDFWSDIKGGYRNSLVFVDYSTAFTGIALFVVSRLRPGSHPLSAYVLVPMMMTVPMLLSVITRGCESHIATVQPAYRTFVSTDEVIAYDVIPVCFANTTGGPFWAFIYYVANFLYTSLGPLIIYTLFIYTAFVEQFPLVQTSPFSFFGVLITGVALPSLLLYMPMGTKVITFFRYVSQSTIVHLIIFVLVFFVYGWQTLEVDLLSSSADVTTLPFWKYIVGPTSPLINILQFTVVPTLLCSKAVAVYDLLIGGNDLLKHIDAGTQFLEAPLLIRRLVGYLIMFAPLTICISFALYALFTTLHTHKMPIRAAFQPTTEWISHQTMNLNRPKPHSHAYRLFNHFCDANYRTMLIVIFIVEIFTFITLAVLLFCNSVLGWIWALSSAASNFRSITLIVLITVHAMALIEMKWELKNWDHASRLTIYIAIATMETAVLNGYMWMYASNHSWGFDWSSASGPAFLIITNMLIRGSCICGAIAVRSHIKEVSRPSRTRDATEIYEPDTGMDVDEDDTPIIFDLARA